MTAGDVDVIDTPGLMDTAGVVEDEANLRQIIDGARRRPFLNAVIVVVNEQAPRFDDGMQSAVKLLVDSFGKQVRSIYKYIGNVEAC